MDQPAGSAAPLPQAEVLAATPPPPAGVSPSDRVPVLAWLIAAVFVAVELAVSGRYGFMQDELYFIEAGRHLAFGYVDQPPLMPLLTGSRHARPQPDSDQDHPGAGRRGGSGRGGPVRGAVRRWPARPGAGGPRHGMRSGPARRPTTWATPRRWTCWPGRRSCCAPPPRCCGTGRGGGLAPASRPGSGWRTTTCWSCCCSASASASCSRSSAGRPAHAMAMAGRRHCRRDLGAEPDLAGHARVAAAGHGFGVAPAEHHPGRLPRRGASPAGLRRDCWPRHWSSPASSGSGGRRSCGSSPSPPRLSSSTCWPGCRARRITPTDWQPRCWRPGPWPPSAGSPGFAGRGCCGRGVRRGRWPARRRSCPSTCRLCRSVTCTTCRLPASTTPMSGTPSAGRNSSTRSPRRTRPGPRRPAANIDLHRVLRGGERARRAGLRHHLPPVLSGHNAYWMWGPGHASDRTVLVVDASAHCGPTSRAAGSSRPTTPPTGAERLDRHPDRHLHRPPSQLARPMAPPQALRLTQAVTTAGRHDTPCSSV